MNANQWQRLIVRAVDFAEFRSGYSLHSIAQRLADADTARESLIAHGYGGDDDSLLACVACVVEGDREGDE